MQVPGEGLEEGGLPGESGGCGVTWGRLGTLCCPQAGEGSSAVLEQVWGAEHPGHRMGMLCFPGKERQGCSASQGQDGDAELPRAGWRC